MSGPFYIGLDLGQANDYTAIAVLEETLWYPSAGGWVSSLSLSREQRELYPYLSGRPDWPAPSPPKPVLEVLGLERLRHVPYPDIVQKIVGPLQQSPWAGNTTLVIDGTGVGAPVVDMFMQAIGHTGIARVVAIQITGGIQVGIVRRSGYSGAYTVPKRDLVGVLQALLGARRLRLNDQAETIEAAVKELQNFKVKLTEAGNDTYGAWREKEHDDLVLALAVACWLRERWNRAE